MIEEAEDTIARGYLHTSDCRQTSKFISLVFKRLNYVFALCISRENPDIRRLFSIMDNCLLVAKESSMITLKLSNFSRYSDVISVMKISINDKKEFCANNIRIADGHGHDIKELLDIDEHNILVKKRRFQDEFLAIISTQVDAARMIFEMGFNQPLVARLYKQYLVTMRLDGLLQIRDTRNNEGNIIYSHRNEFAIAETLIAKYEKVIFCERGQLQILYLKSIEDEYLERGIEVKNCITSDIDIRKINARYIKLNCVGFIEKLKVGVDQIWMLYSDGIIRQTIKLKFW